MSPLYVVKLTALILWCHALVLMVAWFRHVARTDRRQHVGHFVSLVGELVPMAAAAVVLIFGGAALGLPSVVVFLAVVLPLGLVVGLALEVRRLGPHSHRAEARRLAVTLALALAVFAFRGGV